MTLGAVAPVAIAGGGVTLGAVAPVAPVRSGASVVPRSTTGAAERDRVKK